MRRLLLYLAVLMLLGVHPAQAGWTNDPLTFVLEHYEINQPVGHETWCGDCIFIDWTTREPWVVNPTQCVWDVDDEWDYRSVGNILAAGASLTVSECGFQSGQLFAASTIVRSASPDLVVTYSFATDISHDFAVPPVWDATNRAWLYQACIRSPYLPGGTLVEVEGSHGGVATPTTIQVTITNPTERKVGKTGGRISFGWIRYFADCEQV